MPDTEVTITLPLPDARLSPNARNHHMVKAKVVKDARTRAYAYAKMEHGIDDWHWPAAEVHPTFYWPDKRRRDRDNAVGSIKAYLDGICNDAGLLEDDCYLIPHPPAMKVDRDEPRVVLRFVRREKEALG